MNIEVASEPLLRNGIKLQWQRILDLYETLDETLLHKLAVRATNHDDPEICEVGHDVLTRRNWDDP
ncbi:MAG: hypothetical protein V4671_10870 [Armatimonadota bacterium]